MPQNAVASIFSVSLDQPLIQLVHKLQRRSNKIAGEGTITNKYKPTIYFRGALRNTCLRHINRKPSGYNVKMCSRRRVRPMTSEIVETPPKRVDNAQILI